MAEWPGKLAGKILPDDIEEAITIFAVWHDQGDTNTLLDCASDLGQLKDSMDQEVVAVRKKVHAIMSKVTDIAEHYIEQDNVTAFISAVVAGDIKDMNFVHRDENFDDYEIFVALLTFMMKMADASEMTTRNGSFMRELSIRMNFFPRRRA